MIQKVKDLFNKAHIGQPDSLHLSNKASNIFHIRKITAPNSEEKLTRICGDARKIDFSIRLLVIADTHNKFGMDKTISEINIDENTFYKYSTLELSREPSEAPAKPSSSEARFQGTLHPAKPLELSPEINYDLCILLGDISKSDIEKILKTVPKNKIIGILGNHDEKDNLEKYKINNINGKIFEFNGIKFLGLEGCVKYKSSQPGYTVEETYEFFKDKPACDILISHTIPYMFMGEVNNVHIGNPAINDYLIKTNCPLNICGHNHTIKEGKLKNKTNVLELYDICLVDITPEKITIYKKEA